MTIKKPPQGLGRKLREDAGDIVEAQLPQSCLAELQRRPIRLATAWRLALPKQAGTRSHGRR